MGTTCATNIMRKMREVCMICASVNRRNMTRDFCDLGTRYPASMHRLPREGTELLNPPYSGQNPCKPHYKTAIRLNIKTRLWRSPCQTAKLFALEYDQRHQFTDMSHFPILPLLSDCTTYAQGYEEIRWDITASANMCEMHMG